MEEVIALNDLLTPLCLLLYEGWLRKINSVDGGPVIDMMGLQGS